MFVRRWLAPPMLFSSLLMTLAQPPAAVRAEPGPPPVDKKVGSEGKDSKAKLPGEGAPSAAAATDSRSQYANLLDDECPWCVAMRGGPCSRQFATWQRCVKDIKAEQERRAASSLSSLSLTAAERLKRDELEYQRECMDYFRRLHSCIHSSAQSRRYYSPLVNLRQDEDEQDEIGEDEDGWPDDDN